jgi:uncharacterized OsmC-like protein
VTVTLVQYGRTKGWELGEVSVDVEYDNHSTPRRLETVIRIGGKLTAEQLERLEKVARACPLRRSLATGFEFSERIEGAVEPSRRSSVSHAGPLRMHAHAPARRRG